MKKFAIYLPQFHEIPENDAWWVKGFTEWTNVQAARPLFKGHIQPKHPLNGNYYNLLEKDTVKWQTSLLHKYHIDGMVYYHYYFNGKLLLEKPAENLLKWKDINQPFFFCWANHSWMRTWQGTRDMLIEQTYGNEADWEKHFQYLLPFFQDARYEKKDNQPLFMIFKSNIPCKDAMFKYLNKRAIDNGFRGIFFIESYFGEIPINDFNDQLSPNTRLTYYREPAVSQFKYLASMNFITGNFHKINNRLRKYGLIKKRLHQFVWVSSSLGYTPYPCSA